jgi:mannosyl-3-phosphoglycerate phosphatase
MKKLIVFTDLDGTLLDLNTYSFEKALPGLELMRQRDVPLVFCSSKTRKEIEWYRRKMTNHHPFIAETGGGIYIPTAYFPFSIEVSGHACEAVQEYLLTRLGERYAVLRSALKDLQRQGFKVRGFGDMTVEEVMNITGLSREEAVMSQEREFDEPFIFEGSEEECQLLCAAISGKGLRCAQGRFFHITGNSDKGRAVALLIQVYRKQFGEIVTVALGDRHTDLPMFEQVDYPFLVQKSDGSHEPGITANNLIKAEGIGPEGWAKAINRAIAICDVGA